MEEMNVNQPMPWEKRKEIGFFKALWDTIVQILTKPNDFFNNLVVKDSILEPFLFYFVISTAVAIISAIYRIIFPFGPSTSASAEGSAIASFFGMVFTIIFIPIVVAISIFVSSAIMHLFVMMFKGEKGFKGTFNVLCYSAAPAILGVIPFIGGLAGTVWSIILGIIGYKYIHKLTTGKAAAAYLIPIAVIMVLVLLFVVLVLGVALIASQSAQAS